MVVHSQSIQVSEPNAILIKSFGPVAAHPGVPEDDFSEAQAEVTIDLRSNETTSEGGLDANSTTNGTDISDHPRYCLSDRDCIRGSDCHQDLKICVYSIPIIRGKFKF